MKSGSENGKPICDGYTLIDTLNNVRLAAMLEDSKTRGRVKVVYKLEEMSE